MWTICRRQSPFSIPLGREKKKKKNLQNRGNPEAVCHRSLPCSSLSLWLLNSITKTKTIAEEWVENLQQTLSSGRRNWELVNQHHNH